MDTKIIYVFPLKSLLQNSDDISDDILRLTYSILSHVVGVSSDITIYTDFDGAYVLSTLFPANIRVIFSNDIEGYYTKAVNLQTEPFILVRNHEILKSPALFNGEYLLFSSEGMRINPESIKENVSIEYIRKSLNDYYGFIYNKFISAMENKLFQLRATRIINKGEDNMTIKEYFPAPVVYSPIGVGNLL